MFIEHDFGGYAGIKRELDCFNEAERVSRTRTNLHRCHAKARALR
jgi:hypothetical protein